MDIPATGMHQAALDLADPDTPVGARGVGEPPVGAGFGAVLAAIADAVGDDVFRRAPVTPDLILSSLEAKPADARRAHVAHLGLGLGLGAGDGLQSTWSRTRSASWRSEGQSRRTAARAFSSATLDKPSP